MHWFDGFHSGFVINFVHPWRETFGWEIEHRRLCSILDHQIQILTTKMGDTDRPVKMEIDYSSVVDQKLKECDELMKVRPSSIYLNDRFVHHPFTFSQDPSKFTEALDRLLPLEKQTRTVRSAVTAKVPSYQHVSFPHRPPMPFRQAAFSLPSSNTATQRNNGNSSMNI